MQKTKIDWCDMTWNPVTGCLHGCGYCYARKIANRFKGYTTDNCMKLQQHREETKELHVLDTPMWIHPKGPLRAQLNKAPYPFGFAPTFHRYRFDEPQKIKKPQKIFVCSMADLFGDFIPDEWILEVLEACGKAPWHHYLFLTKNPLRYEDFVIKNNSNIWFGITLENQTIYEIRGRETKVYPTTNLFLSIEPIRSPIVFHPFTLKSVKWVIVGQETGNRKDKVIPKDEWVQNIINQCRKYNVPVFIKEPLYKRFPIQEFPKGLGREVKHE